MTFLRLMFWFCSNLLCWEELFLAVSIVLCSVLMMGGGSAFMKGMVVCTSDIDLVSNVFQNDPPLALWCEVQSVRAHYVWYLWQEGQTLLCTSRSSFCCHFCNRKTMCFSNTIMPAHIMPMLLSMLCKMINNFLASTIAGLAPP